MTIGNWYRVGTVAVTNGSVNVVGTGTFWTSQCNPGDRFTIDGDKWYEINNIADDTHMALLSVGGSGAYAGTTASNIAYAIDRNFTNNLNANIAASVASLVAQYQANSNGPLSGLFGNGAAATPGIAFLGEASTGLFHPAAGIAALAIQGAEFLRAVGTASGVPAMLGIGTSAPANGLDLLCTSNALYGARIQNGSAGTAARAALQLGNTSGASHVLNLGVNGASFTASGVLAPSRGFVEGPNGVDFASGVTAGNAFTWGTGAAYGSKMALDFAGNLSLTGNLTAAAGAFTTLSTTGNVQVGSGAAALISSIVQASGTGTAGVSVVTAGQIALSLVANSTGATSNGIASGAVGLATGGIVAAPIIFAQIAVEKARIDSSGNLLLGQVSATNGSRLVAQGAGTAPIMSMVNTPGSSGTAAGGAGIGFALATRRGGSDCGDLTFWTTLDANGGGIAEKMRLLNNGPLLVGYTASNGAYSLQVNGQIFATSATIATSDQKFKTNVVPIASALDLVNALRPVEFDYLPDDVHNFPSGRQIGFIAQEVRTALAGSDYLDALVFENNREAQPAVEGRDAVPEQPAVLGDDGEVITPAVPAQAAIVARSAVPADEFLGLADAGFTPLVVKALQELHGVVTALQETVGAQAAVIATLRGNAA